MDDKCVECDSGWCHGHKCDGPDGCRCASEGIDALRAENEKQQRKMKAHRETAVAAIAGAEKECLALRAALAEKQDALVVSDTRWMETRAENERLHAIVEAAQAFVTWHQRGQPGTPGTLYPMTYGALDEWHAEWDRNLETLMAAVKDA